MRRRRGVLGLFLVALAASAAPADWETTRRTVIDPLNTELHRHLPAYVKSRDLDAILELYATTTGSGLTWDRGHAVYPEHEEATRRWEGTRGPEPIRTRYVHLLALLATIEKAELRIDRVAWRTADADGYPARVRLLVRGTRADGMRAELVQAATLRVAQRDGRWRITREEVTARTLVTRRTPRFSRATDAAGIASVHTSDGSPAFRLFGGGPDNPVGASSGVAVADVDGDGCEDVFLAGSPDAVLYRNDGDGTSSDVTRHARVGNTGWGMAAAWADYDGDGWPDLYVANEFGGNALYHNERDGTFSERAATAGVVDGGAGMGAAWGDVDGDGNLDLFVSNMHANSAWALFHPDFPAPIPWFYRLLGFFTDEVQRRSDDIIDRLTRGSTLYRNDGDGTFTDVSDAAGVRDAQWGWSAEFLDYDNDGRLDLYAVNGFISGPILDDV